MTLFPGRARQLERTGDPNLEKAENHFDRALGRLRTDLDSTAQPRSFTPGASASWAGDPTTLQEAIDRLAAAYAASHGPVP